MSWGKTITAVLLMAALTILLAQTIRADCSPSPFNSDTLQANPWKDAIEASGLDQKEKISPRQQKVITALVLLLTLSFLFILKYGKDTDRST